jgi:Dolichyl-phosphate-mannose-protein mannosyltransferase
MQLLHDKTGNSKLIFMVFGFFLLINLASAGGHLDGFDGVQIFLLAESMALKHSVKLYSSLNPDLPSMTKLFYKNPRPYNLVDPFAPTYKPTYSERSHLLAAIAVPFYYAALILSASPITVVALFVNPIIISLTSVVIFCFSLEIYRSKKIAFVLSLIFGVCSFILPYNNMFEPNPLQGLCIVTAAYFIYVSAKRISDQSIYFAGLAGLFLGFSVFAHPDSIIVIPGFIAYSIFFMKFNKRCIGSFLITLVLILIFAGLVNYWRFGSFTEFGYSSVGSLKHHNGWAGLIGLLLSPGAGLIFYFPITVLLPLAFRYMYSQNIGLFVLFGYIIFVNWLVVGTTSLGEPTGWSGGGSWGPRSLISVLPFIAIVCGSLFLNSRKVHIREGLLLKISIILLCIGGFYVTLVGNLIWTVYGIDYGLNVAGLNKLNNHAIDFITWVPYYSPIVLHTEALISNYPSHIKITHAFTNSYKSFGNAPCSYDLYIYCKLGIAPVLLLCGIVAALSILIVAEISDKYNTRYLVLALRNHFPARRT